MRVGLLGALEVAIGGEPVAVAGGRVRALLARLALDAGREVPRGTLIDAIWDEHPPGDAAHALQALVSRLRRALAPALENDDTPPGGAIRSGPIGYSLAIAPEAVDALLFERLAAQGSSLLRAGDPRAALPVLHEALALWRGPALGELAASHQFARNAAGRLDDLCLATTADRIEAELALGAEGSGLVAELDALTSAHPLHERLAGQRLRALAAAGRQADALDAYEQLRRRLDDELGALPSAELVAAHLAVVDGSAGQAAGARSAAANGNGSAPREAEPSPGVAGATTPDGSAPPTAAAPHTAPPSESGRAPRRTNLRFGVTSFVGRDEEIPRLGALLDQHRLVTLIGPGGAGKTRLAGEVAALQTPRREGGVWMVELAQITDPADLGAGVLGALGLREARLAMSGGIPGGGKEPSSTDAVDHLLDVLAEREAVLVLDNCEHLVAAVAVLADELLAHCPHLRIIATSREPLGIDGEQLALVPPLSFPAADAAPDEALGHPAVRLFADRAASASPGFVVDEATVGPVVEICRRLDGLPLAIELAAARLRSLPVAQIAARLDDRFRLLTGGSRAALPRQRTLRAVVDWSWDLLEEPERALARRIAVFPAGVTPETAEAVCAGGPVDAADVADLLAGLVDRSLLQLMESDDGTGAARYRMLETIREYGTERMEELGELAGVRTAHARYFAELVDEADPHLRTADQLRWLRQLQAERENVLSGLRWLADSGDAARAVRLSVSLAWFWFLSGASNEAGTAMALALEVPGDSDPLDHAIAENVTSITREAQDPRPGFEMDRRAREVLDQFLALDRSGRPITAVVLPMLGWAAGDFDLAEELFAQALAMPDPWVRACVPLARAQWAENSGDTAAMRRYFDEALLAFRDVGERWGLEVTLTGIGALCMLENDLEGAAVALEEARTLLEELGAEGEHAMLHLRLADVRHRMGELDVALHHAREAWDATDLAGPEAALTAGALARLLWQLGQHDEARETLVHALATVERLGDWQPGRGHVHAMVRAIAAGFALEDGELGAARTYLAAAYPASVGTDDLPVIGLVGLTVAALALTTGEPAAAAEILGAGARLRGSDDPTNPEVRRLTALLREALGSDAYDAAFAAGRSLDRDAAIARIDPASL